MCEAERQCRRWTLYVQDMLAFGEKVLSFTDGPDQDTFTASRLTARPGERGQPDQHVT